MLPGTLSRDGLLLLSATVAPGSCAPPLSDTVDVNELPPTTSISDGCNTETVGGGGGGGADPFSAIFVINASPQNMSWRPLKTRSNAPAVVGKSAERVMPVTYALPAE